MVDSMPAPTPDPSSGGTTPPSPGAPPGPGWGRLALRLLKRLAIAVVVFAVFTGALLALAERETSKPEFCGSCHIMKPYYDSWQADAHGTKLGIACVECHYAPGERTTLNAKLRGLSQVASYVSGRYGTTRPRAHVDNLSCLTSKCHGDLKFMDKPLTVGTVTFVHAKHLRFDEAKKEETERERTELSQALSQRLGKERFSALEEVAREATPTQERLSRMTRLVSDWGASIDSQQLLNLTQLHHREVRVAQLTDLQCTNCHSYVAPEPHKPGGIAHHFTVKTTACYTCHFNNEGFNTGTGKCLMCHTLPTKDILVHAPLKPDEVNKLKSPELAKPVKMNHEAMLKRKVDCISCHADIATAPSAVSRRDCERCHDRPEYFPQWKQPLSLDVVKHYHAVHVPEQRAKCLDCHAEIQHQLVRDKTPAGHPGFLSSVMSDCAHCHPNHHADQVKLLSGAGGVGVAKGEPNLMFGARTNCFGCHTKEATTAHGDVAMQAAVGGCVSCHGERHADTFKKWKQGLQLSQMDAEEAYQKARKSLEKAKGLSPESRRKVEELLTGAQNDLQLVKRGNGVHNVMYSMELLDSVTRRSQQASSILSKEAARKP